MDASYYRSEKAKGRWTDEEHARFKQALMQHGRDWKKITRVVGTRSVVQVRSHAQKYFLKLMRAGNPAYSDEMLQPDGEPRTQKSEPALQVKEADEAPKQEPIVSATGESDYNKLYDAWLYHTTQATRLFQMINHPAYLGIFPRDPSLDGDVTDLPSANRKQGID